MATLGRPVKAAEKPQTLTDAQLRYVIANSKNPFVVGMYKAIQIMRETEARRAEEARRQVEP